MVTVKVKYELTLKDRPAEGAIEAWLQAQSEQEVKEYFIEYLAENLATDLRSGALHHLNNFKVLHIGAEWRPDNDK